MNPDDHYSADRFTLASDRTLLANERTLAAWWRTAMTALAAAVAFARLFGDATPQWLIRGGASFLVLLAFAILGIAYQRYETIARRIESQYVRQISRWSLWSGTTLLALTAMIAGAFVWL